MCSATLTPASPSAHPRALGVAGAIPCSGVTMANAKTSKGGNARKPATSAAAAPAAAPAASPMPTTATLPQASTTAETAPLPTTVSVAGAHVPAARNVVARAAALANVPAALANVALVAGKPCRVRVPYTLQCWEACKAALAKGPQTGAALASVSTGDFVRYAVSNKWLVPAAAPAEK